MKTKLLRSAKTVAVGVVAAALTISFSVFATTIGTNITSDGTLTINGNSTFGDAAADINLFTGTLQASTTALFTGNITTYGNLTVGDASTDTLDVNASTTLRNTRFGTSGATITGHLSASSTVDFASMTAASCNTQTVTVTGANQRDTVVLGVGDDLGGVASSTLKAWVSAADTVSIQMCLFLGAATTNPGPAALRVDIWQH